MLAKTAWNSPETVADKYLDSTTLDGEAVAVFGWDSYCAAGTILNAQHRVYISQARSPVSLALNMSARSPRATTFSSIFTSGARRGTRR